jgi:hypothetical protein
LCSNNAVDDDDDDVGDDDSKEGKIHPLTGHEGPEVDSRGIDLLFL